MRVKRKAILCQFIDDGMIENEFGNIYDNLEEFNSILLVELLPENSDNITKISSVLCSKLFVLAVFIYSLMVKSIIPLLLPDSMYWCPSAASLRDITLTTRTLSVQSAK